MIAGKPAARVWLASAVVFVASLSVYLLTAAPGLTWAHDSADGGDLVAAALVSGVPHPTGYPSYTLLARVFTRLPWHTPAWRVTLLSAVAAALAAALVTASVLLLSRQCLAGEASHGTGAPVGSVPGQAAAPFLAAIAAGCALAFSPLLWGQATVAEVYALNALVAAALIWTLVRYRQCRRPAELGRAGDGLGWATGAGLMLGLGLGNHLTTVWLLPLAIAWLVADAPRSAQRGRGLLVFGLGLVAGLVVYLYLPWAAQGNPPVNWGNPRTWTGFWWLVSGSIYRPLVFAVSLEAALGRVASWAALLWRDFLPWIVISALAGLALCYQRSRWVTLGALGSLGLGLVWAIGYDTTDSVLTLLPGWVLVALWAGVGLFAMFFWLAGVHRHGWILAMLLCAAIVAVPVILNWSGQDLSHDVQAQEFADLVLDRVEPSALLVTAGDRATFALWYVRYGLAHRPDVTPISRDLWPLESYRDTIGATDPSLEDLRAALAPLLLQVVAQRPVYFAQAGPAAAGLEDLGLPENAPYKLEQVAASSAGSLWRLLPRD